MSDALPSRPNLEWLRKTAKDRLRQLRATANGAATQPANAPLAKAQSAKTQLADAQLAVAREYGFPSWRRLVAHVEQLGAVTLDESATAADSEVGDFLEHVGTGRIDQVRAMLAAAAAAASERASASALVNAVGPHPFWGGRPQALHVAIESNRRNMFDLLIEHGADVNGSNDLYDHWSPLMIAIDRKHTDMRDELVRRGARIGLLEALMLGDDGVVEKLLRAGKLPDITPNGGSILAFARTPFAIDRLLELGAPTDVRDRWESTPIDAMSRLGPSGRPLVEHMIRRGIGAEPKEYARLGDIATLSRLIDADPAIARLDSVMMAAVDFGHHALVTWLLARGANVNARSEVGSRGSALHSAAFNGDLEMVKLLVTAGADRAARDPEHNNTPEGWAQAALRITNNPQCAEVAAYLAALPTQ